MSTEIKLEESMQRIYSCSLTKLKIVTWRKQIAVTILFESFVLISFALFTVQALLQKQCFFNLSRLHNVLHGKRTFIMPFEFQVL
jgi:hypothetical protein